MGATDEPGVLMSCMRIAAIMVTYFRPSHSPFQPSQLSNKLSSLLVEQRLFYSISIDIWERRLVAMLSTVERQENSEPRLTKFFELTTKNWRV